MIHMERLQPEKMLEFIARQPGWLGPPPHLCG
jgi:hypothetical protein